MKNFEKRNEPNESQIIKKSFDNLVVAKRSLSNLLELEVKPENEDREMIEDMKEKIDEILKK